MRTAPLPTVLAIAILVGRLAAPALAQSVTVDPKALDALPGTKAPVKPQQSKAGAAQTRHQRGSKPPAPIAAVVKPPAPPTLVPPAPPPVVILPEPIVVPTRPVPPTPPPNVRADAPGAATKLPSGGLRVTFAAVGSDLNPATDSALRDLAREIKAGPASLNVSAFAAGSADDASVARRLSLSRALAVRGALITEGIPSVRIYVRALGATSPAFADGPPDRVDVVPTPETAGAAKP